MKKFSIVIFVSILSFLSACATDGVKNNPSMSSDMQKGLKEIQAKGPAPVASQPEVIPAFPVMVVQELTWSNFEMVFIELDKNKKPKKSEKIQFEDKRTVTKSGPQVNINSYSLNSDTGKVVQLSCPGFDLKQKFSSATLLKGWAVEFNCNKNDYFVIINQK